MELMPVLWWLLAAVLVAGGLIGTVYPLLPGLPMLFGGLWIAAWADHYQHVGSFTLWLLGALTALGLLIDFVASSLGAKRSGASPQAVSGALLGSIVGMFFGLPGLIVGPFVGAMLGELKARGGLRKATQVGVATFIGLLLGTAAKLALGIAMVACFVFAWFV